MRRHEKRPSSRLLTGALLLALAPVCPPLAAWGRLGHEIAGDISAQYLTPLARQRVDELLDQESLAEASHWADRMRADPAAFWQHEAGPYHYVTIPAGRTYDDIGPPPQGDALTALTMFEGELRAEDTPLPRRRLALRFALHIIQDLQQPLHVGNGRDRGGNDIRLPVRGEPGNLHRVWDSVILESAGIDREAWLPRLQHRGLLRTPTRADADPRHWLAQSTAVRESLYPVPREIDERYLRRQLPVVEERVALAGLRGAAWLNAVLADAPPVDESRAAPGKSWWQRLLGRFTADERSP